MPQLQVEPRHTQPEAGKRAGVQSESPPLTGSPLRLPSDSGPLGSAVQLVTCNAATMLLQISESSLRLGAGRVHDCEGACVQSSATQQLASEAASHSRAPWALAVVHTAADGRCPRMALWYYASGVHDVPLAARASCTTIVIRSRQRPEQRVLTRV